MDNTDDTRLLDYRKISNIRHNKSQNLKDSRHVCSCLCPIHWKQVLSWEWRCSWSLACRRCSNYIWVINKFITYYGAPYIRGLTVSALFEHIWCMYMRHAFLYHRSFAISLIDIRDVLLSRTLLPTLLTTTPPHTHTCDTDIIMLAMAVQPSIAYRGLYFTHNRHIWIQNITTAEPKSGRFFFVFIYTYFYIS